MTAISLVTTRARLAWGVSSFDGRMKPWTLSLNCKLENSHRLRLKSGEAIEDISISVGFVFDDEARVHYDKQVNDNLTEFIQADGGEAGEREQTYGVGSYFAARDDVISPRGTSLHFTVYLPEEQHSRVIEHARHGQWPRNITLGLLGPQMGWEPDGSGIEWDNAKWPRVGITSVAFDIPLAVEPDHLEPVETGDQPKAATPVGADLLPTLARLAKWQTYVFWALMALLIVTISHR